MRKEGTLLRNSVDEESIASIVSKWTGIPVNKNLKCKLSQNQQHYQILKERFKL